MKQELFLPGRTSGFQIVRNEKSCCIGKEHGGKIVSCVVQKKAGNKSRSFSYFYMILTEV